MASKKESRDHLRGERFYGFAARINGTLMHVSFTSKEVAFINQMGVCRLATADKDGVRHVTPVCHAFDGQLFYIATDFGVTKLKNLSENPGVSLVVDEYSDRWARNRGIMIQGVAEVSPVSKAHLFRDHMKGFSYCFALRAARQDASPPVESIDSRDGS